MSKFQTETEKAPNKLLIDRFSAVRKQSLSLCEPLEKEDFVVQPTMDVSPPKWHLAHTTWFFETFLLTTFKKNYKIFKEEYGFLFNSYYVTVGDRWSRTQRGHLSRPTVDEIIKYRNYVDEQMNEFLLGSEDFTDEFLHIFEVGIQHEQQHQELLLYDLKWILGENPIFPAYRKDIEISSCETHRLKWLSVDGGNYEVGAEESEEFSFDNERFRHTVFILPFEIASRAVNNGEFLEFIEDGGYKNPVYWMMDGMDWIQEYQIQHPKYWHKLDGKWYHYTLAGFRELDLQSPLSHVSFYEADAFARWSGHRLPTEYEWEIASRHFEPIISKHSNFVDNNKFQPVQGHHTHFMGNLWEWTESAYRPYPYFRPDNGALGEYNGKFMINQMVLKGGSYATPKNHIRHTYRNFFHPHLRWSFNGVRLAKHI